MKGLSDITFATNAHRPATLLLLKTHLTCKPSRDNIMFYRWRPCKELTCKSCITIHGDLTWKYRHQNRPLNRHLRPTGQVLPKMQSYQHWSNAIHTCTFCIPLQMGINKLLSRHCGANQEYSGECLRDGL